MALLAAQSQSASRIDASGRDSRKATTLKYSDEETRQLLTTLAAGTALTLAVGGNFTADIGEKNADGTLRADRMTADGIVKGDSRQQVSVTRTGVDADSSPTSSQVRGDLASQGIRNGANDAFTPGAKASGGAALEQYLASGLVQIKNEPVVAGELKRILQSDGTTLSVRDASGQVSLTVAGQAKVQDVYNTLKLSETFDEKHFANAAVAQAVTLVAAIVLTVMTGGAGAGTIGAALTAANTAGAAMINAAVIAAASTMTGQLAGGASFDDALQAGLKAGAVAAASAGVASGVSEYVNGTTAGTPTTLDSAGQQLQVGSNGASGLTHLDRLGTSAFWQQTTLNATAQGVLAEVQGGSFKDGFTGSVIGSLSATGAGIIGDTTVGMPVTNVVAHAALGCASAAASGKDCASGALGGAGSAIFAPIIDSALAGSDLSRAAQDAIIAGGSVAGSIALASAVGKDAITAGNAAANEVTNNFLMHKQPAEFAKRLRECQDSACEKQVKLDMESASKANQELARSCFERNDQACIADLKAGIQAAEKGYAGNNGLGAAMGADANLFKQDGEANLAALSACAAGGSYTACNLGRIGADGVSGTLYAGAGSLTGGPGKAAGTAAKTTTATANVESAAAKGVPRAVATPYGAALQGTDATAIAARAQVEQGATLYRIGTLGKSQAAEAQFWSLENPSSPGYAARYGIPESNVSNANFVETATLKPGTIFVTRPAPQGLRTRTS